MGDLGPPHARVDDEGGKESNVKGVGHFWQSNLSGRACWSEGMRLLAVGSSMLLVGHPFQTRNIARATTLSSSTSRTSSTGSRHCIYCGMYVLFSCRSFCTFPRRYNTPRPSFLSLALRRSPSGPWPLGCRSLLRGTPPTRVYAAPASEGRRGGQVGRSCG